MDDYSELSDWQLRDMLRDRVLDAGGTRDEMLERLLDDDRTVPMLEAFDRKETGT